MLAGPRTILPQSGIAVVQTKTLSLNDGSLDYGSVIYRGLYLDREPFQNPIDCLCYHVKQCDLARVNMNRILEMIHAQVADSPELALVFYFENRICGGYLSMMVTVLRQNFARFHYVFGYERFDRKINHLVAEILQKRGDLSQIKELVCAEPTPGISIQTIVAPVLDPRYPFADNQIGQTHRDWGVRYLREAIAPGPEQEGEIQTCEAQIYQAACNFQEYVNLLLATRIRIKTPQQGPVLGKRKRDQAIWYYNLPSLVNGLENLGSGAYGRVRFPPEIEALFEERNWNQELRTIPFEIRLFPEQDQPFRIDLGRGTVNGVPGSLLRRGTICGIPSAFDQSLDLDGKEELLPESSMYQAIVNSIQETLPAKTITIWKLHQPIARERFERKMIAMRLLDADPDRSTLTTKLLFTGTGLLAPDLVGADGLPLDSFDPDPDCNWGQGIHLSASAEYAHDRGYQYQDEQGMRRHQIFVGKLGYVSDPPDYMLVPNPERRTAPCGRQVNEMKIEYDVVLGEYSRLDSEGKVGKEALVHIVYHREQVYPEYLVEYSL